MDQVLHLFSEECNHNEKFKENFSCLQKEYVKLCFENEQLQSEIVKIKNSSDQPFTQLQTELKKLELDIKEKERTIIFLQTKLDVAEKVVKEKDALEEQLLSKIASTELALEQAYSLLASLQNESKMLMGHLEESYHEMTQKCEREKIAIIDDLKERCIKSENEKRDIAQKVLSATEKASRNISHLKQENSLFRHAIEKLKKALEIANSEQSELASQHVALKVQHEQEQAEFVFQIRNLQCELVKVKAKAEISEKSLLETFEEKNRYSAQLSVLQSEISNVRNQSYEKENLHKKETEKMRKVMENVQSKHNKEKDDLLKANNVLERRLDLEIASITQLSEKLRARELALTSEQENLRKRETEAIRKIHDARIKTENKYRGMLEEKLRAELDLTRKISELESHLILERNLKSNVESQLQNVLMENAALNDRLKSDGNAQDNIFRLERELSKKEDECIRLTDELDRWKRQLTETCDELRKEKESVLTRCIILEDRFFQEKLILQEEVKKNQNQVVQMEHESKKKIDGLQTSLRDTRQKSQQYAKLIWKLRQRLSDRDGESGILNTSQLPTNSIQQDKP